MATEHQSIEVPLLKSAADLEKWVLETSARLLQGRPPDEAVVSYVIDAAAQRYPWLVLQWAAWKLVPKLVVVAIILLVLWGIRGY